MPNDIQGRWIEFRALCERLAEVAQCKPAEIFEQSVSEFGDLHDLLNYRTEAFPAKAVARARYAEDLPDLLRVSCLFNSITFFQPPGQPHSFKMSVLDPEFQARANIEAGMVAEEIEDGGRWDAALVTGWHNSMSSWVADSSDLMRSGRLLPLPHRGILLTAPGQEHEGIGGLVYASPFGSYFDWVVGPLLDEEVNGRIWTRFPGDPRGEIELTLPFLRGIPLSDLNKLLDDEHDLLAGLRIELRDLARGIDPLPPEQRAEYARDMVQSRIDKIERRFRSLSLKRRIYLQGITLGAVTATYCSISMGALEHALTAGGAALAAAGKTEADHTLSLEELRDDPLYFLWKVTAPD